MKLIVDFAEHTSHSDQRMVLSFLNALTGSAILPGEMRNAFTFSREAKLERARRRLAEWERDGLLGWRVEA